MPLAADIIDLGSAYIIDSDLCCKSRSVFLMSLKLSGEGVWPLLSAVYGYALALLFVKVGLGLANDDSSSYLKDISL